MSEVLEGVIAVYGREVDEKSRAKIRRYLETLSSTGKTDLTTYGLAYLEQLHNPDPRYTGC
jgi:hypothetical protein